MNVPTSRLLRRTLLAGAAAGLCAVAPSAQIEAKVQLSGQLTLSVDGAATNDSSAGTLSIDKPAGATVHSAYFVAATFSNYVLQDGDMSIDGNPVDWDCLVTNDAGSFVDFYVNGFADVTAIVKPIIDVAAPGQVDLAMTEVPAATFNIDGGILAVVFDDPNQTTENGIILLFGGQATAGDTFVINLAEPLDLTSMDAKADMGLGISFSFQGSSGTTMISELDVNGQPLSRSAGGEDDGFGSNGGLITVGGFGDSNDNPPPLAGSSGFDTDDELYDLLPFVNTGDMSITVDTLNPTDDDNIFFGYFVTSVPSAVGESVLLSPVKTDAVLGDVVQLTAAVVDDNGNPIVGRQVDLDVLAGPNAGLMDSGNTDAQGEVVFLVPDAGTIGIDSIVARMIDTNGDLQESNIAEICWAACDVDASTTMVPDAGGLNNNVGLDAAPVGSVPSVGNASFAVGVDDPNDACGVALGTDTYVLFSSQTAALVYPGLGCAPGGPGEIMISPGSLQTILGPVAWAGAGQPAVHALPIPFDTNLCGFLCHGQGMFFDPSAQAGDRITLTNRLDILVGN